jgi:uncharacterized protein
MPWGMRWLLAALGVLCFVFGIVGVLVPGVPTTVFLIVGSYLLTRSCPWIERRLMALPFLRPYAKYLDPAVPLSRKARQRALIAMWMSIVIATLLLVWHGSIPALGVALVPVSGALGTWVILRFRREPQPRPAAK